MYKVVKYKFVLKSFFPEKGFRIFFVHRLSFAAVGLVGASVALSSGEFYTSLTAQYKLWGIFQVAHQDLAIGFSIKIMRVAEQNLQILTKAVFYSIAGE